MYSLLQVASLMAACAGLCRGQTVEQACKAGTGTWVTCGIAVKQELDKASNDPKHVLAIANLWAGAYASQYDFLRKTGKLATSTPDADKIADEVKSKLDLMKVAEDKGWDLALKRLLPLAAVVCQWAKTPLGEALKKFLDSSDIATDYDELRMMNETLQIRMFALLAPHLREDWKATLNKAVIQAAPRLTQP